MSHRHRTIRTPSASRDAETSAAVPWRRSTPWLPGGAPLGILAVKLVVLGQLASHPLLQPRGVLDDAVYLKLAQRVASGDLALGPDVYYLSPFYMYFLGAILAAGGSVFAARAVQVVLGSVAVLLVGLIANAGSARAPRLPPPSQRRSPACSRSTRCCCCSRRWTRSSRRSRSGLSRAPLAAGDHPSFLAPAGRWACWRSTVRTCSPQWS